MPDANGQYQLQDYLEELRAEGFSGFSPAHLTAMVNRAYRAVANKARWRWELTSATVTVASGSSYFTLWPTSGGSLPNFQSVSRAHVVTSNQHRKLRNLSQTEFDVWLAQDLTLTSGRAEPTSYFVWRDRFYVLPVPMAARDIEVTYYRRVSALVEPTDVPITPIDLDEAIMIAARIRAHNRSHEPDLAQDARAELEEIFDDMRDDDATLMEEEPERVSPDDTWL